MHYFLWKHQQTERGGPSPLTEECALKLSITNRLLVRVKSLAAQHRKGKSLQTYMDIHQQRDEDRNK